MLWKVLMKFYIFIFQIGIMDKEYGSCNLWGDFYFRGFDLKK